jgi:hypothetical protein
MLTVLYHIRINTWATAGNTAEAIKASGKGRDGASFATGGWITGGIPGVDSVRLLAQQEEFMVNRNATRALTAQYGPGVMDIINAGRLPSFNDNPLPSLSPSAPNVVPFRGGSDNSDIRALLLQVEKLTNLVDQLRKENNSGNEGIAKAGREDTGTIVDALTETGKKRDATARETARSRRLSQAG